MANQEDYEISEDYIPSDDEVLLKLQSMGTNIKIIAKNGETSEVAVRVVQTAPLFAYYWINKLPEIETFLNTFETILKRTINEIYPHEKLAISYNLKSNDTLEDSNEINIIFNSVKADDKDLKIIGNIVSFENPEDDRGLIEKITSFRRKVDENITKVL